MLVYRIAKTDYVRDLTGIGAKLYGGRWNHQGTALIYTSETRALATIEYLVHVSMVNVPKNLSMAILEVPDDPAAEMISPESLPRNWRDFPALPELADFGTQWAQSERSLLLAVPSAVVTQEHNILINPLHPEMARVVLRNVENYEMDTRLFP
jgi:RES domain-containing protein